MCAQRRGVLNRYGTFTKSTLDCRLRGEGDEAVGVIEPPAGTPPPPSK